MRKAGMWKGRPVFVDADEVIAIVPGQWADETNIHLRGGIVVTVREPEPETVKEDLS